MFEPVAATFQRMGVRLKVVDRSPSRAWLAVEGLRLDVRSDAEGEYFEIDRSGAAAAELQVLDVRPRERHLLLLVRERGEKHKFLCGHDERHWFVAAVPETAGGVGSVRTAQEALKPAEVRRAQVRAGVPTRQRGRRRTAAYVRQGEWFFLPEPTLAVPAALVLRNEPLRRGRGKPHVAEFAYRSGGEQVYVCPAHPNGLNEAQFRGLIRRKPEARSWNWWFLRRDASVYVQGRVRHADHKTITLRGWHRVLLNTENQAAALRHLAFLD
jgi:hypothetical protein